MNGTLLRIFTLRSEGRHEEAEALERKISAAGSDEQERPKNENLETKSGPACELCGTPVENQPGGMNVFGVWVPCTLCGEDKTGKTGWDR